jgi:hypothetical protein
MKEISILLFLLTSFLFEQKNFIGEGRCTMPIQRIEIEKKIHFFVLLASTSDHNYTKKGNRKKKETFPKMIEKS